MSRFVDERVVEMSFDNKRFESNVKTSMGTINKLKDALNFSGTTNTLNKHLNSVDTNPVSRGLANLSQGFSALELMGVVALANITNRLVDLAFETGRALSGIDQLSAGWSRFEEASISEATLLAQGFDQSIVTDTIEKLLWFTDETSYSFSDMLNNMAQFTAAGVGLEDAQNAMMGIANWAALSGQNAAVASRAMHQLSQAMGSGVVRLQHWRSIETANMATEEFKNMILETAVSMEELIKNVDGSYTTLSGKTFESGQFRDFLSEGFLTTDVLTKTLEAYSTVANEVEKMMQDDSSLATASRALDAYEEQVNDLEDSYGDLITEQQRLEIAQMRFGIKAFRAAQEARTLTDAIQSVKDAVSTGWTRVFTNIFGAVEEAKVLWTDLANELYDVFMDGMWKKIDILSIWAENGGREDLFARTEENTGAFWNLFDAIIAVRDLIRDSWNSVFGFSKLEGEDEIEDLASKLKNFTENLKRWSEGLLMSESTAETLTNIFSGFFTIIKLFGQTVVAIFKGLTPIFDGIRSVVSYLLRSLGMLSGDMTEFAQTTTIFEKITAVITKVSQGIVDFVTSLDLLNNAKLFVSSFAKGFNKSLGDAGSNISIIEILKRVIHALTGALLYLVDAFNKYVLPYLPKFFSVLGKVLGSIVGNVLRLTIGLFHLIKRFVQWVRANERIQNGLKSLRNVLVVIGKSFISFIKTIGNFFNSLGKSNTKPVDDFSNGMRKSFGPLKTLLEGLTNLFKGLWHVIKSVMPVISAIFTLIGTALNYIGNKLQEIFSTDAGEVNVKKIFTYGFWAVILVGIFRFAEMLRSVTKVFTDAFDGMFDYFNSKAMKNYMEAIRTMAISILLMVGALLILGSMDPDTLKRSMIALTALVAFIVGTMVLMKKLITGTEVKSFIKDGPKRIKETKKFSYNLTGMAAAFIGIGVAVLLLAASLKVISNLDPDKLWQSMGVVAAMMVMMVSVMKIVGKIEKGSDKAVRSMVKVAISVALLARPLKKIGEIDTKTGIKGLIGIGTLMLILVGFSKLSKAIDKSQKPIHGLISTAIALTMMIIPLKVIGGMDNGILAKAGIVITGLFAIMVATSKIMDAEDAKALQITTKSLISLAYALALFGVAMLIVAKNDWSQMAKSAAVILVLFAVLVQTNRELDKKLTEARVRNMTNTIKSLIPLSVALAAFGIAMRIVAKNDWIGMSKSAATILVVFGVLAFINKQMDKDLTKPRVKNMDRTIWSLIPLSIGLATLGAAMLFVGQIPWQSIGIALGTMIVTLGILSGFTVLLNRFGGNPKSLILMGAALSTISVGLILFGAAIYAIGNIPLKTIGIGLLGILGAFTVLAVAGFMLKPLVPVLLALAGAFALFGLGVLLLAGSMALLMTVIAASSVAFIAGLAALAVAIVALKPVLIKALLALVEIVAVVLIKIIEEVFYIIGYFREEFRDLILNLVLDILDIIYKSTDKIVEVLFGILMSVLTHLANNIYPIAMRLVDIVLGIVRVLRERSYEIVYELTNLGFDLFIALLNGFGRASEERSEEVREAMIRFGQHMIAALKIFFKIKSPSKTMMEFAGYLVAGIIQGLWNGLKSLVTNITNWASQVLAWFSTSLLKGFNVGKDFINNMINGAKDAWTNTKNWFGDKANEIGNAFSSKVSSLKSIGSDLIKNVSDGAKSMWDGTKGLGNWALDKASILHSSFANKVDDFKDVGSQLINGLKSGLEITGKNIKDTVTTVAGNITGWFKDVFGIKSPSRVFAEMGMYLDLGLAKGIRDHSDAAYDAANDLGDDTVDGIEKSGLAKVLSELNNSLESEFDNEIVIRPVLDLSEIQNGKNKLYDMMSEANLYALSGSNSMANRTRDDINKRSSGSNDVINGRNNAGNTSTEVINNTFNIRGSNPKEIAEEVSRVLQSQVDRRKAKWAL
ncbi:MAG: tape measure protein [Candidatus Izemoplasmataceae bacterium]